MPFGGACESWGPKINRVGHLTNIVNGSFKVKLIYVRIYYAAYLRTKSRFHKFKEAETESKAVFFFFKKKEDIVAAC